MICETSLEMSSQISLGEPSRKLGINQGRVGLKWVVFPWKFGYQQRFVLCHQMIWLKSYGSDELGIEK